MPKHLVERHGGQMLRSFAQAEYMRVKEYGEYLDEGVCAALSTTWIARRAQGKDFFKYLESPDARNEVAMLQGRELGLSKSVSAAQNEFLKVKKESQEGQQSLMMNVIPLVPKAVLGMPFVMPFVRDTVLEQEKKAGKLKQRSDELRQTREFLNTLVDNQHQYRADYIKDQTGLEGNIDKFTTTEASRTVSSTEGFVIFGMNGHGEKSRAHAVALYHGRDGVRFFDPNFGEAFFRHEADFQGFLSEFVQYYSDENRIGPMQEIEITDFPYPVMPKSPEDAEFTDHGYQSLNLSFLEWMGGTSEERTPLLSDTD